MSSFKCSYWTTSHLHYRALFKAAASATSSPQPPQVDTVVIITKTSSTTHSLCSEYLLFYFLCEAQKPDRRFQNDNVCVHADVEPVGKRQIVHTFFLLPYSCFTFSLDRMSCQRRSPCRRLDIYSVNLALKRPYVAGTNSNRTEINTFVFLKPCWMIEKKSSKDLRGKVSNFPDIRVLPLL